MRDCFLSFGLALLVWFSTACGNSLPVSSPAVTPLATTSATIPAPTATRALKTPTPTSPLATRPPYLADITLRWDPTGGLITDIDDVSELAVRLKEKPGIVDAYGDEIQITVTYDSRQITPEGVQRVLADLGHPTLKP